MSCAEWLDATTWQHLLRRYKIGRKGGNVKAIHTPFLARQGALAQRL